MRTKTLLLTAALSAAGLATSMAQVYSVNAVGYVNVTVNPNSYRIIANPLNGTNNSLNTVLPLPDNTYDGASIYRFDPVSQQYLDTIQYLTGLGWFSPSDPNPTVNPGEGFFFQNVAGTALNLTFVGEVPAGATLNNPLPSANKYSIRSSVVPKSLRMGTEGQANTLGFPAEDGDSLYVFNHATQQYEDTWQYLTGLGWFSPSDPNSDGPLLEPGNGLFLQKGATATKTAWTQSFSVN